MKLILPVVIFAISVFSFEIQVDTVEVLEKVSNIYINNSSDTLAVDSVNVVLLKSLTDQYQLQVVCGTEKQNEIYRLFSYESVPGYGFESFHFIIEPGDTMKMLVDAFDYCVSCIGTGLRGVAPTPMSARMIFFTSQGVDSLVVSGTQTTISYLAVREPMRKRVATKADNTPPLFDIQGRKVYQQGKNGYRARGMSLLLQRSASGTSAVKKIILSE